MCLLERQVAEAVALGHAERAQHGALRIRMAAILDNENTCPTRSLF